MISSVGKTLGGLGMAGGIAGAIGSHLNLSTQLSTLGLEAAKLFNNMGLTAFFKSDQIEAVSQAAANADTAQSIGMALAPLATPAFLTIAAIGAAVYGLSALAKTSEKMREAPDAGEVQLA